MGEQALVAVSPVPTGISEHAELQAALEISPLIGRVDVSLLWVTAKIFAAAYDKRVRRGGYLFLAHLFRFSIVIQLSLFPGTEVGDVAKIEIPNILKLCLNKKQNGWPWCYDTTLKYLHLLVAAGVLITRPGEPGIYYVPLGPYALLPEHAGQQIERLARRRSKLSKSAAFKRAAVHCTLLGTAPAHDDPQMVDSPQQDALVVDEQEMQRMIEAIGATVKRCQGNALHPTTVVEITRIIVEHTPRVVKKRDGRSLMRSKQETQHLLQLPQMLGTQHGVVSGREEELHPSRCVTAGETEVTRNLSSSDYDEREANAESTIAGKNLLMSSPMVDSPRSVLTDEISNIRKNPLIFSDNKLSESRGKHEQESTCVVGTRQAVDSSHADPEMGTLVVPPHPLAEPFSLSALLYWRFPGQARQLEPQQWEQEGIVCNYLAALLSDHFEHNDSRVPHYIKRLKQDARTLDIAIVDSLVRSCFPDPRHKPEQLGGPWVTKMFKLYRDGTPIPPEIQAWADTAYSYDVMQAVLEEAARWQETQGQTRRRPRPENVIVDSEQLGDFWVGDAAVDLKQEGYFGVELDGDLFTCEAYEQWRLRLLEYKLFTDSLLLSPEVEHEVSTYQNWAMPWVCDREEEARLLANLPSRLQRNLKELERVLDPQDCEVEVGIAPLSHHAVIEVRLVRVPGQVWFLRNGRDIEEFDSWYRRTPRDERGVSDQVSQESTNCRPEKRPDQQEKDECMDRQVDLSVGLYHVYFDPKGATIEHTETKAQYRLEATTATNATDLVRCHRAVVKAMTNDSPGELEMYRVELQIEDGLNNGKE